jgi:hypothetical protein
VGIGRIGKVLDHAINDLIELITETYKGFNQKGILYNSSGEDSPPVKDDKIFLVKADGSGKYVVVGVLTKSQGAKPGEKIFFARDEGGNIKSKLSMLGEGSIIWEADGDFKLDGKKNIEVKAAQKASIKGMNVELSGQVKSTGGSFECGGNVAPTGNGALCGCKYCYVTGAAVAGDKAIGT